VPCIGRGLCGASEYAALRMRNPLYVHVWASWCVSSLPRPSSGRLTADPRPGLAPHHSAGQSFAVLSASYHKSTAAGELACRKVTQGMSSSSVQMSHANSSDSHATTNTQSMEVCLLSRLLLCASSLRCLSLSRYLGLTASCLSSSQTHVIPACRCPSAVVTGVL